MAARRDSPEAGEDALSSGSKEKTVEGLHDKNKEHRGEGISLTQPPVMHDFPTKPAIDDELRARGRKQQADQITPTATEAERPEKVQEEGSGDRIKSTSDVQFEKDRRLMRDMERPSHLLHNHEVVMDGTTTNERTLVRGDQRRKNRSQPEGEHLGDPLCQTMNQANRTEVPNLQRAILLGDESETSPIEIVKASTPPCV